MNKTTSMPTMEQCAPVCKTTIENVLTSDEMMQVVEISPYCVPLCQEAQASGKYVGREGQGMVQMDTHPRDDLQVVGPEMQNRVYVPRKS